MTEREEFEAWVNKNHLGVRFITDYLNPDGTYVYVAPEWDAWQACSALKDKRIAELDGEWQSLQEMYGQLLAEVRRLTAERDALKEQVVAAYSAMRTPWLDLLTERDALKAALTDAIECVQDWGIYASEYFQKKHDLDGDIARLKKALGNPE